MTTTTSCSTAMGLKRSKLAPPQENGSPDSGTPPTDAGGDPCPSCSSHTPVSSVAADPYRPCRCGRAHAGDKARGGYTGGEPVAAADAVRVESGGGGGDGGMNCSGDKGGSGREGAMVVAPEAGVGRVGMGAVDGDAAAAAVTVGGAVTATVSTEEQQPRGLREGSSLAVSGQGEVEAQAADDGRTMVVDVEPCGCPEEKHETVGGAQQAGGGGSGGGETWSVCSQAPATVTPREGGVSTGEVSEAGAEARQEGVAEEAAAVSQADTMDRLAQSLAQVKFHCYGVTDLFL